MMKLMKPFSLTSSKSGNEAYYQHRQWLRFLNVLGVGIHRIAEAQTNRIIEANQQIGNQLDNTLKQGFNEVQEYQREIHHALVDQSRIIKAGMDQIEVTLSEGFDQVSGGLSEVANRIDNVGQILVDSGERMHKGLAGIKASVDMGMMSIVSQFELQREEIQEGFVKLTDILENNRKTEARERYRDGKQEYERYLQHPDEPQFLIDAYDYLQESIKTYRGNPFCHLYLGHIYHEPAQYYDLEKALEHYLLCATYAKGIPNNPLVALGYFMAGWIHYVTGNVEAAIEAGEKSLEYDEKGIPENYFNLAKFYARQKNTPKAIDKLNTAVQKFDPLYTIKADIDDDFQEIRNDLDHYFSQIRESAAKQWDNNIQSLGIEK
ncbi:MAG: hypothetical protein KDD99_03430 [Bacteroidetes bacterium]|nr:hypothetical protein [Bacteroidota bacterium]